MQINEYFCRSINRNAGHVDLPWCIKSIDYGIRKADFLKPLPHKTGLDKHSQFVGKDSLAH